MKRELKENWLETMGKIRTILTKLIPMKRELKVIFIAFLSPVKHLTKLIPMKRELKVHQLLILIAA